LVVLQFAVMCWRYWDIRFIWSLLFYKKFWFNTSE